MNNWDVKPGITVVYGTDVPFSAMIGVARNVLNDSILAPDPYSEKYPMIVVPHTYMEPTHVKAVIESIMPHACSSDDKGLLSCSGCFEVDKEESLQVNVRRVIYYAHNCRVEVHHISI